MMNDEICRNVSEPLTGTIWLYKKPCNYALPYFNSKYTYSIVLTALAGTD